ncbi:MAG TPA: T9SS type A sorting domain-containing protein [Bacteroidia bacterium]
MIYSTFNSPASGNQYTSSIGGLCIGCQVGNPANAASMSMTDSTHLYMTVGLNNKVKIKVKLTDTANANAGFIIGSNTGLLNASLLNGVIIRTYFNTNLQETFAGGSLLNLSLLSGSKQCITANASMKFNYIELELNNTLSLLWDVNVYYGFGMRLVALPVHFSNEKLNTNNGVFTFNWQSNSDQEIATYTLLHSKDGVTFTSVASTSAVNGVDMYEQYQLSAALEQNGMHFFKIIALGKDGLSSHSKTLTFNGQYATSNINVYPNPSNGRINFSGLNVSSVISITDFNGRIIHTNTIEPNTGMDVSNFEPGLYHIRIEGEDGSCSSITFKKIN